VIVYDCIKSKSHNSFTKQQQQQTEPAWTSGTNNDSSSIAGLPFLGYNDALPKPASDAYGS
jgi:hypothetical protein